MSQNKVSCGCSVKKRSSAYVQACNCNRRSPSLDLRAIGNVYYGRTPTLKVPENNDPISPRAHSPRSRQYIPSNRIRELSPMLSVEVLNDTPQEPRLARHNRSATVAK